MGLLQALRHTTVEFDAPFRHWEIDAPLTPEMVAEVASAEVPEGPRAYDGTRAADAGGAGLDGALRCFVTPDNVGRYPALGELIEELLQPETVAYFEQMTGQDLAGAFLRFEIIVDREGFWLQPHKDIPEKLTSMQLYVNEAGESESLGTDIYRRGAHGAMEQVKTIPYRNNYGYLFVAADDSWHGLEKKAIVKERRSLLINYVTFETPWRLASPATG